MIYLGHFSFDTKLKGESKTMEPWHAKFAAIAEADDIEGAVGKFHALVGRGVRSRFFDGKVDKIYLDACIEIKSLPKGGLIGQISYENGETDTLSTIPSASSRSVDVWSFGMEGGESPDKPFEVAPFFEVKKERPKPKPETKTKTETKAAAEAKAGTKTRTKARAKAKSQR